MNPRRGRGQHSLSLYRSRIKINHYMMNDKKTILVVEDERPLAEAIRLKLEKEGMNVAVARTVEQALGYLGDLKRVDGIWLDHYLLGTENGLDFVVRVKAKDSAWVNIPIFVVSNTATADKVQSYLRLGVNKYYVKAEYRLDEIIAEIKRVLVSDVD